MEGKSEAQPRYHEDFALVQVAIINVIDITVMSILNLQRLQQTNRIYTMVCNESNLQYFIYQLYFKLTRKAQNAKTRIRYIRVLQCKNTLFFRGPAAKLDA